LSSRFHDSFAFIVLIEQGSFFSQTIPCRNGIVGKNRTGGSAASVLGQTKPGLVVHLDLVSHSPEKSSTTEPTGVAYAGTSLAESWRLSLPKAAPGSFRAW
jgi:hypothetical protein